MSTVWDPGRRVVSAGALHEAERWPPRVGRWSVGSARSTPRRGLRLRLGRERTADTRHIGAERLPFLRSPLCPDPQWPLDLTLGCDGALTNMRHADDDSVAQQRAQRQMRSAGAAVLPGDGRGPRPRLGAATRGNTRARSGLGRLRVPSGSRFEPKRRWDGGGSCTGTGCSGRQCRANADCR